MAPQKNDAPDPAREHITYLLGMLTAGAPCPTYAQRGMRLLDYQTRRHRPVNLQQTRWVACMVRSEDGHEYHRNLSAPMLCAHLGLAPSKSGLRRGPLGKAIYSAAFPELGRLVVLDVDAHGTIPAAPRTRAIVNTLRRMGCEPLVCGSPGRGHHVTAVLPVAVSAAAAHQVARSILRQAEESSGISMQGVDPYPSGSRALRLPIGDRQTILDPDSLELVPGTLEVENISTDVDVDQLPTGTLTRFLGKGRSRSVEYYLPGARAEEWVIGDDDVSTLVEVWDPTMLVTSARLRGSWTPAENCEPEMLIGRWRLGPRALEELVTRMRAALLPEMMSPRSAEQTEGQLRYADCRLRVCAAASSHQGHEHHAPAASPVDSDGSSQRPSDHHDHPPVAQKTLTPYLYQDPPSIPLKSLDSAHPRVLGKRIPRVAHLPAHQHPPVAQKTLTPYLYQDPPSIPLKSLDSVPETTPAHEVVVTPSQPGRAAPARGPRSGAAPDPRDNWNGRWRQNIRHLLENGVTIPGTRNAAIMKLAWEWSVRMGYDVDRCVEECRRWALAHQHASRLSGAELVKACTDDMRDAVDNLRAEGHVGRGRFSHKLDPHAVAETLPASWQSEAAAGTVEQLLASVDERARDEASALLLWLCHPVRSGTVAAISSKLLRTVCGTRRYSEDKTRKSAAVLAKDELERLGVLAKVQGHRAGHHGTMYQVARFVAAAATTDASTAPASPHPATRYPEASPHSTTAATTTAVIPIRGTA